MSTVTLEERPEEKIIKIRLILWATALFALLMPIASMQPLFFGLTITICYLAIVLFFYPKIGLLALLILRPILDRFSTDKLFLIGGYGLNFASILALVMLVFAFLLTIKKRKKIATMPLTAFWLLFLATTLVGVLMSFDNLASLAEWLRLLSIFALFLSGFLLVDTQLELKRLVKVAVLSALIPGFFALYQYFTDTGLTVPLEGIYNRIYGTFAHPNLFAYYLVLVSVLAAYLLGASRKKFVADQIFFLPLVFFLALLVLTFTRGAWLALVLVMFIVGLIKFRKFLVVGLVAILFAYIFVTPINNRVNDLFSRNPYGSISWRIKLWTDSLAYVGDNRLLGYGTGLASELILEKRGEAYGSSDPHNDYLKIALENGLIGLFFYAALLIALVYRLLAAYLAGRGSEIKILALILFGLTISFIIMGFADNILRNTALMWAFWSLAGALFAVSMSTHETTAAE